MGNSYIVDIFLSYSLLAWIAFSFINIKAQLADLNARITASLFAQAMYSLRFIIIPIAIFSVVIGLFLVYRFYAVLLFFNAWGVGGAGMILLLSLYILIANSLQVVLFCVRHSEYVIEKPIVNKNIKSLFVNNEPMHKVAR